MADKCQNCGKPTNNPKHDLCKDCFGKQGSGTGNNTNNKKNAPKEQKPSFDVVVTIIKQDVTIDAQDDTKAKISLAVEISNHGEIKPNCPVCLFIDGREVDEQKTTDWGRVEFEKEIETSKILTAKVEIVAKFPVEKNNRTVYGLGRVEVPPFKLPAKKGITATGKKCSHCAGSGKCENETVGNIKRSCGKCRTADGTKNPMAVVVCSFCGK